eukprot:sb/3478134/
MWGAWKPEWAETPDKVAQRVMISKGYQVLEPMSSDTPKPDGHVRFVCLSDTHSRDLSIAVPDGDVLLHAGDMTNAGTLGEFKKFRMLMESLPHKHKIVIAGMM